MPYKCMFRLFTQRICYITRRTYWGSFQTHEYRQRRRSEARKESEERKEERRIIRDDAVTNILVNISDRSSTNVSWDDED